MNFARRLVSHCALFIPTIVAFSAPAHAQLVEYCWAGTGALTSNAWGDYNTAAGHGAMQNTGCGTGSCATPETNAKWGDLNSALGYFALRNNIRGSQNTALGSSALRGNVDGFDNTAVGFDAARNTAGVMDSNLGDDGNVDTGNGNTAVGSRSLRDNSTGKANTAVGALSLYLGLSTNEDTSVGYNAGPYGGGGNTAIGAYALLNNQYRTPKNTAVGRGAAMNCTTCASVVAVGYEAAVGPFATAVGGPDNNGATTRATGNNATALGNGALASGHYSVAVGSLGPSTPAAPVGSPTFATGLYSTVLGNGAQAAYENSMALGAGAVATGAHLIRIGNTAISRIEGQQMFTTSDGRYKTSIKENVPGLEFITKLKPVTFKWDLGKLNKLDGLEEHATDPVFGAAREAKSRKVNTGFIAQDVEAAAQECGYDFSGVVKPENDGSQYQLAYSEFVVPLVKAVQEQQKEIEELREAVRALSKDGRLPGDKLGQGSVQGATKFAGMLDNFWGGAMTLLGAALVLFHFKRRGVSPVAR
jgi:trimeric autotransporter adhesin